MDSKVILEKINTQTIIDIMEEFGESPYKGGVDSELNEVWFRTICHEGDSHKLCYYKDSKTFYCYTNCGFMSVYDLVGKTLKCNFKDSLKFIGNYVGYNDRQGLNILSNTFKDSQLSKYASLRKRKKKENYPMLKTISNPKVLLYFENNVFHRSWIEEGISIATMKTFKIAWYEIGNSIIIPHLNEIGEIVGIRRRSFNEEDLKNKYMPLYLEGIGYEHSLNINFYGLCQHMRGIKKFKKVVLVESEKSVMLAHEFYGDDCFVIATCGFNISMWHIRKLLQLGVEEVIIGFDKDFDVLEFEKEEEKDLIENKKFDNYVKRVLSMAHKMSPYFRTYVIWDRYDKLDLKDSPFDKGKETLEFLMKNKQEINTEDYYPENGGN